MKYHLVVERTDLSLAALMSRANRHDSMLFEAVLDAIPAVRTPSGQRHRRPDKLHGDKERDIPRCHRALTKQHIQVRIACKGVTVPYEQQADIHQTFLTLGCAVICFKAIQKEF